MSENWNRTAGGEWVVEPGDSITSIAFRSGHSPDTIWNDAANDDLRKTRKDPEVLLPGDSVKVMAIRAGSVACVTGKRHVFRRRGTNVPFTLVLEDEAGQPFAGKRYEIVIDDRLESGLTDDGGRIECTVAPDRSAAKLRLWLEEPGFTDPVVYQLALSALCPVEHPRGMQQRLSNLGFYRHDVDGVLNDATRSALAAFAAAHGLESGAPDDPSVLGKLVEVHRV